MYTNNNQLGQPTNWLTDQLTNQPTDGRTANQLTDQPTNQLGYNKIVH